MKGFLLLLLVGFIYAAAPAQTGSSSGAGSGTSSSAGDPQSNGVGCDSSKEDKVKRKKHCGPENSLLTAIEAIGAFEEDFAEYPKSLKCEKCPDGQTGCDQTNTNTGTTFQTMYYVPIKDQWCFKGVEATYKIDCSVCVDSTINDTIPPDTTSSRIGLLEKYASISHFDEVNEMARSSEGGDEPVPCGTNKTFPYDADEKCFTIGPGANVRAVFSQLVTEVKSNPNSNQCDTCDGSGCTLSISYDSFSPDFDSLSLTGTDSTGQQTWCMYGLDSYYWVNCSACIVVDSTTIGDSIPPDSVPMRLLVDQAKVDELQALFETYPNPVSDVLYLSSFSSKPPIAIKLYDANGRLLKVYAIEELEAGVNVSTLPAGFYYLRLLLDDGTAVAKKFYKVE